jgi:kynurenine formamidase
MAELRFVDLSVPIQEPLEGELEAFLGARLAAKIDYKDHTDSENDAEAFGCTVEDLPEGLGWAEETLTLSTHAGTHLDAPWHYFPTSEGAPAKTIDQLPLESFFGPGVVLDLTEFEPGEQVHVDAVKKAVEATGAPLAPKEIVLLRFDADATFGTGAYWTSYPGLTAASTEWLIEQGVKLIGTDAVGFDRDFASIAADFDRTGDRSLIWEAHRVGIKHEYFQIEKLTNLSQLPPRGFVVASFPVKITGASAGWCRTVAILGLDGLL